MKKSKVVLLLALSLLAAASQKANAPERSPAEPAAVAQRGLWQKALDVYRKNRDWYPERIAILSEVLNRHGQPYSVTELFFAIHMSPGGSLRTELVRALKNGEDTTEKMRSKVAIHDPGEGMGTGKEDTYSVSISDSPFDPERQKFVTARANGERKNLFGHACRRFDFSYRTAIVRKGEAEELTWTGMAWLEEGSGVPVKLEFSLAPLPSRIRSLWTIYLYETARPGQWVVKKVAISGQGGFLFIKKRFRTTTTFSNYRLPPPKKEKS